MIAKKKSKEVLEESHDALPGWCCACGYDIILLERRIEIAKEILLDKVKELVLEELALAHTTKSGKTSRLTSLANKIYELQKEIKKKERTEVR